MVGYSNEVFSRRASTLEDASEDEVSGVLRALRRTGDEAQWTQVIAAIAGADDRFATDLAQVFVDAAPNKAAAEALGAVPSQLTCQAERTLQDAESIGQGRVDLLFSDEDDFALLCELKLHS